MKLSVIIANYNYQAFVGAAIESALAVDWPQKEVIVVDDGSSDDSRSVIDCYQGRIAAYLRPKSHQLGAHIFGFGQSTGDIIIFLDADDLLEPNVMRELAKIWRPGVSKVQYRMNLIDADGTQLGTAIPQFPPKDDPEGLRRAFLRTMTYTTPPGSGNAYSRAFVREVFALGPTIPQSDAALLTLAPILGDVLTIRKPLARYRSHPASYGGMQSLDAFKLRKQLNQDVERARLFARVSDQLGIAIPKDPLNYSFHHLQYRLASYLADRSAHPFPNDSILWIACRLVSSATKSSQMRFRDRTILVAWTIGCILAPPSFRRNLILWRFAPTSRPPVIKAFLGVFSSLRSRRLPDRAETSQDHEQAITAGRTPVAARIRAAPTPRS